MVDTIRKLMKSLQKFSSPPVAAIQDANARPEAGEKGLLGYLT
jgi:hypothetical protein